MNEARYVPGSFLFEAWGDPHGKHVEDAAQPPQPASRASPSSGQSPPQGQSRSRAGSPTRIQSPAAPWSENQPGWTAWAGTTLTTVPKSPFAALVLELPRNVAESEECKLPWQDPRLMWSLSLWTTAGRLSAEHRLPVVGPRGETRAEQERRRRPRLLRFDFVTHPVPDSVVLSVELLLGEHPLAVGRSQVELLWPQRSTGDVTPNASVVRLNMTQPLAVSLKTGPITPLAPGAPAAAPSDDILLASTFGVTLLASTALPPRVGWPARAAWPARLHGSDLLAPGHSACFLRPGPLLDATSLAWHAPSSPGSDAASGSHELPARLAALSVSVTPCSSDGTPLEPPQLMGFVGVDDEGRWRARWRHSLSFPILPSSSFLLLHLLARGSSDRDLPLAVAFGFLSLHRPAGAALRSAVFPVRLYPGCPARPDPEALGWYHPPALLPATADVVAQPWVLQGDIAPPPPPTDWVGLSAHAERLARHAVPSWVQPPEARGSAQEASIGWSQAVWAAQTRSLFPCGLLLGVRLASCRHPDHLPLERLLHPSPPPLTSHQGAPPGSPILRSLSSPADASSGAAAAQRDAASLARLLQGQGEEVESAAAAELFKRRKALFRLLSRLLHRLARARGMDPLDCEEEIPSDEEEGRDAWRTVSRVAACAASTLLCDQGLTHPALQALLEDTLFGWEEPEAAAGRVAEQAEESRGAMTPLLARAMWSWAQDQTQAVVDALMSSRAAKRSAGRGGGGGGVGRLPWNEEDVDEDDDASKDAALEGSEGEEDNASLWSVPRAQDMRRVDDDRLLVRHLRSLVEFSTAFLAAAGRRASRTGALWGEAVARPSFSVRSTGSLAPLWMEQWLNSARGWAESLGRSTHMPVWAAALIRGVGGLLPWAASLLPDAVVKSMVRAVVLSLPVGPGQLSAGPLPKPAPVPQPLAPAPPPVKGREATDSDFLRKYQRPKWTAQGDPRERLPPTLSHLRERVQGNAPIPSQPPQPPPQPPQAPPAAPAMPWDNPWTACGYAGSWGEWPARPLVLRHIAAPAGRVPVPPASLQDPALELDATWLQTLTYLYRLPSEAPKKGLTHPEPPPAPLSGRRNRERLTWTWQLFWLPVSLRAMHASLRRIISLLQQGAASTSSSPPTSLRALDMLITAVTDFWAVFTGRMLGYSPEADPSPPTLPHTLRRALALRCLPVLPLLLTTLEAADLGAAQHAPLAGAMTWYIACLLDATLGEDRGKGAAAFLAHASVPTSGVAALVLVGSRALRLGSLQRWSRWMHRVAGMEARKARDVWREDSPRSESAAKKDTSVWGVDPNPAEEPTKGEDTASKSSDDVLARDVSDEWIPFLAAWRQAQLGGSVRWWEDVSAENEPGGDEDDAEERLFRHSGMHGLAESDSAWIVPPAPRWFGAAAARLRLLAETALWVLSPPEEGPADSPEGPFPWDLVCLGVGGVDDSRSPPFLDPPPQVASRGVIEAPCAPTQGDAPPGEMVWWVLWNEVPQFLAQTSTADAASPGGGWALRLARVLLRIALSSSTPSTSSAILPQLLDRLLSLWARVGRHLTEDPASYRGLGALARAVRSECRPDGSTDSHSETATGPMEATHHFFPSGGAQPLPPAPAPGAGHFASSPTGTHTGEHTIPATDEAWASPWQQLGQPMSREGDPTLTRSALLPWRDALAEMMAITASVETVVTGTVACSTSILAGEPLRWCAGALASPASFLYVLMPWWMVEGGVAGAEEREEDFDRASRHLSEERDAVERSSSQRLCFPITTRMERHPLPAHALLLDPRPWNAGVSLLEAVVDALAPASDVLPLLSSGGNLHSRNLRILSRWLSRLHTTLLGIARNLGPVPPGTVGAKEHPYVRHASAAGVAGGVELIASGKSIEREEGDEDRRRGWGHRRQPSGPFLAPLGAVVPPAPAVVRALVDDDDEGMKPHEASRPRRRLVGGGSRGARPPSRRTSFAASLLSIPQRGGPAASDTPFSGALVEDDSRPDLWWLEALTPETSAPFGRVAAALPPPPPLQTGMLPAELPHHLRVLLSVATGIAPDAALVWVDVLIRVLGGAGLVGVNGEMGRGMEVSAQNTPFLWRVPSSATAIHEAVRGEEGEGDEDEDAGMGEVRAAAPPSKSGANQPPSTSLVPFEQKEAEEGQKGSASEGESAAMERGLDDGVGAAHALSLRVGLWAALWDRQLSVSAKPGAADPCSALWERWWRHASDEPPSAPPASEVLPGLHAIPPWSQAEERGSHLQVLEGLFLEAIAAAETAGERGLAQALARHLQAVLDSEGQQLLQLSSDRASSFDSPPRSPEGTWPDPLRSAVVGTSRVDGPRLARTIRAEVSRSAANLSGAQWVALRTLQHRLRHAQKLGRQLADGSHLQSSLLDSVRHGKHSTPPSNREARASATERLRRASRTQWRGLRAAWSSSEEVDADEHKTERGRGERRKEGEDEDEAPSVTLRGTFYVVLFAGMNFSADPFAEAARRQSGADLQGAGTWTAVPSPMMRRDGMDEDDDGDEDDFELRRSPPEEVSGSRGGTGREDEDEGAQLSRRSAASRSWQRLRGFTRAIGSFKRGRDGWDDEDGGESGEEAGSAHSGSSASGSAERAHMWGTPHRPRARDLDTVRAKPRKVGSLSEQWYVLRLEEGQTGLHLRAALESAFPRATVLGPETPVVMGEPIEKGEEEDDPETLHSRASAHRNLIWLGAGARGSVDGLGVRRRRRGRRQGGEEEFDSDWEIVWLPPPTAGGVPIRRRRFTARNLLPDHIYLLPAIPVPGDDSSLQFRTWVTRDTTVSLPVIDPSEPLAAAAERRMPSPRTHPVVRGKPLLATKVLAKRPVDELLHDAAVSPIVQLDITVGREQVWTGGRRIGLQPWAAPRPGEQTLADRRAPPPPGTVLAVPLASPLPWLSRDAPAVHVRLRAQPLVKACGQRASWVVDLLVERLRWLYRHPIAGVRRALPKPGQALRPSARDESEGDEEVEEDDFGADAPPGAGPPLNWDGRPVGSAPSSPPTSVNAQLLLPSRRANGGDGGGGAKPPSGTASPRGRVPTVVDEEEQYENTLAELGDVLGRPVDSGAATGIAGRPRELGVFGVGSGGAAGAGGGGRGVAPPRPPTMSSRHPSRQLHRLRSMRYRRDRGVSGETGVLNIAFGGSSRPMSVIGLERVPGTAASSVVGPPSVRSLGAGGYDRRVRFGSDLTDLPGLVGPWRGEGVDDAEASPEPPQEVFIRWLRPHPSLLPRSSDKSLAAVAMISFQYPPVPGGTAGMWATVTDLGAFASRPVTVPSLMPAGGAFAARIAKQLRSEASDAAEGSGAGVVPAGMAAQLLFGSVIEAASHSLGAPAGLQAAQQLLEDYKLLKRRHMDSVRTDLRRQHIRAQQERRQQGLPEEPPPDFEAALPRAIPATVTRIARSLALLQRLVGECMRQHRILSRWEGTEGDAAAEVVMDRAVTDAEVVAGGSLSEEEVVKAATSGALRAGLLTRRQRQLMLDESVNELHPVESSTTQQQAD